VEHAETTPHPPVFKSPRFGPDTPLPGVTTLVTLGLSRHHLRLPNGNGAHQELLMHLPIEGEYPAQAAGIMFQIATEMVTAVRASKADN
jgi:hypothetical protein